MIFIQLFYTPLLILSIRDFNLCYCKDSHCSNLQVPLIGLVMGDRGLISRVLCAKFGGYMTFGTLESGVVSAPGQPSLKDLLHLYNFRALAPDTKVFGLIGKPVRQSKSPMLLNEAFKSVGFNGVYIILLVDDIANFLRTYSSTDFVGFRFQLLIRIFHFIIFRNRN